MDRYLWDSNGLGSKARGLKNFDLYAERASGNGVKMVAQWIQDHYVITWWFLTPAAEKQVYRPPLPPRPGPVRIEKYSNPFPELEYVEFLDAHEAEDVLSLAIEASLLRDSFEPIITHLRGVKEEIPVTVLKAWLKDRTVDKPVSPT